MASTGVNGIGDRDGEAARRKAENGRTSATAGNGDREETIPFIDRHAQHMGERPPPADRYNMVYFIVMLHGVGVLLPWNSFLTLGKEYFIDYKLAEANGTEYAINFFSYLGACSQIPNLLLNLLNLFVVVKGAGLTCRIFTSLYVIFAICVLTIGLIFVSSTQWPLGFFLLTMFSVILLNSANGVYQNSIYGLIADFPPHFTNAVILGNNLCGIFVSFLAILTLLFSNSIRLATFLYFLVALMTVLGCIFSFYTLPKFPFYRYYTTQAARARERKLNAAAHAGQATLAVTVNGGHSAGASTTHSNNDDDDSVLVDGDGRLSLDAYVRLLSEVWRQMLNVFLVFFVTLAIFPAVLVKVQLHPAGRTYDFFYSEAFFRQITIFLNFNVFATLGSFMANHVQWPSPKYLTFAVVPRLLFIPLFLFTNYVPATHRAHFPVLIANEWAFVILVSLLSVSHGYLSSLSMMYAPHTVDKSKARAVGMMSGFFLVFGITMGILFTFLESSLFSF